MELLRMMVEKRWRRRCGLALGIIAVAGAACASSGASRPATQSPESTETSSVPATVAVASPTPRPSPTDAPSPAPPVVEPTEAAPDPRTAVPSAEKARVVYRGNPLRRMVALTFDAGSDVGYTAQILETLRAEGVRASFGMTGKWAEQNHDLLLAIAAGGHEFINHTYDHASFTGLSSGEVPLSTEQRALEISRTETTIYHLTGRTTRA